jgi:hypothetical protein
VPLPLAWGVDSRPVLFPIGLLLVALIGWGVRRFGPPPVRRPTAMLVGLMAYVSLFWFIFYGPYVGVERSMTFPMTWRLGEPGFQASKQAHVILEFRDYPGHHIGIFSDDVANYLRRLGSDTVDVTFVVMTTWGRTNGFREVRIGDLASWRAEGGYSRVDGLKHGPSPWP